MVERRSVVEYLESLGSAELELLYGDSSTCQAVFRSLPSISKVYVLRMLYSGQIASTHSWLKPQEVDALNQHKVALERLLALRLIHIAIPTTTTTSTTTATTGALIKAAVEGQASLTLNSTFQKNLQHSLANPVDNWDVDQKSKHCPSEDELSMYSNQCWTALLRFMIAKPTHAPSVTMANLLIFTNLMQLEGTENLRITNKGFKFLLKDTYTQIWTLLFAYIESTEARKLDKREVISFLFQLSFLSLGKGYSVERLSETQKILLQDLREFGIIYQRKASSTHFYPTQLALTLSTGKLHKKAEYVADQCIVLEPNYRLYAYTRDELQINILSLFVKMKYRMPNMTMGVITRESIRTALISGITANEVIDYLLQHAHPEMQKNTPVLPETVADQIRLWEAERNRVTYASGVLFDGFPSDKAFQETLRVCKENGIVVLWSNAKDRKLMVSEDGAVQLQNLLKGNKA